MDLFKKALQIVGAIAIVFTLVFAINQIMIVKAPQAPHLQLKMPPLA